MTSSTEARESAIITRTNEQVRFTPGPWRIHSNFSDRVCAGPISADGIDIAYCSAGARVAETLLEREANARLIAAAPDMYEALVAVVAATKWRSHSLNPKEREALEKSRAALTKTRDGR